MVGRVNQCSEVVIKCFITIFRTIAIPTLNKIRARVDMLFFLILRIVIGTIAPTFNKTIARLAFRVAVQSVAFIICISRWASGGRTICLALSLITKFSLV